jgi:hypothetical protein
MTALSEVGLPLPVLFAASWQALHLLLEVLHGL